MVRYSFRSGASSGCARARAPQGTAAGKPASGATASTATDSGPTSRVLGSPTVALSGTGGAGSRPATTSAALQRENANRINRARDRERSAKRVLGGAGDITGPGLGG